MTEKNEAQTTPSPPYGDTIHITIGANATGIAIGKNIVQKVFASEDQHSLREWWHQILREEGRYQCYAIFLVLPSDGEPISYLTDFGGELDLISGENCLVIALSGTEFRRHGFDKEIWNLVTNEQASEGYSLRIAKLFGIDLAEFPCLVLFQDIRSPIHVTITLKGMTALEIAVRMRVVFSTIQKAVSQKVNPLEAIESMRNSESFQKAGQTIISQLRTFAGKTFETAIEAWIKSVVK